MKEEIRHIIDSGQRRVLLARFRVGGNARFLSHSDTMRVFTRALVRACVEIEYSQGFNPRAKVSLPVPRSVGVESDDELLCVKVRVDDPDAAAAAEDLRAKLGGELPEGIELISVALSQGGAAIRGRGAEYVLELGPGIDTAEIKRRIEEILGAKNLEIRRRTDAEGSTRIVDVRGFIESIEVSGREIKVRCQITPTGTIRPEEILALLGIEAEMLAKPLRRSKIEWE